MKKPLDLSFKKANTTYLTHGFHSFAARFPPQLPRLFIERLTKPGEMVLDPMCGSGTTNVEALLLKRNSVGLDIDPLAVLISKCKVTPLSIDRLYECLMNVVSSLLRFKKYSLTWFVEGRDVDDTIEANLSEYPPDVRRFFNYWFKPKTIAELATIVKIIREIEDPDIRRFFEVCFSSIIIRKSGGVSLARDLAHSRPHRDARKRVPCAFDEFIKRAYTMFGLMKEFLSKCPNGVIAEIIWGDCRELPIEDCSIDLIVTSPPYANAIDYLRAHKFSLFWLGYTPKDIACLYPHYIGTERGFKKPYLKYRLKEAEQVVQMVINKDEKRGAILANYFNNMVEAISEMHRVLKPGKRCIIVIGPSTIRGILVETHKVIVEIGEQMGFKCISIIEREIDRDKRQLPLSRNRGLINRIEARIHSESVIIFRK